MRYWIGIICVMLLPLALIISCGGSEDKPAEEADTKPEIILDESAITLMRAPSIYGEWTVESKNDLPPGSIVFNEDGTYKMTEYREADMQVTLEGQFKMETGREPYIIDLCLGDCRAAGAQFVTRFGIIRFISEDRAEIRFSTTEERPTEFGAPADENTLFLDRKRQIS